MKINRIALALLAMPAFLAAQDVSLALFDTLALKAKEKVDVKLDGALLQLAGRFLSDKNADEAKVKNLLNGLKGIYVRSLKFASEGEYSMADVDAMKAQLKGWSEIVSVRGAKENTGVYLKLDGQKVAGLVIIAGEPMELTVVNIVGSIDPAQVRDLSGNFGIPELNGILPKGNSNNKKGNKDKD